MPKNSSRFDQSISPEKFLFRNDFCKKVAIICFLIVCGGVVFIFFASKKTVAVNQALPSGPIVYCRMERPFDHLQGFLQSRFWKEFSKIDVEKLLTVGGFSSEQIQQYRNSRKDFYGFVNSPLFKQFFSKEVAVAMYPPLDGFVNGDWPKEASGFVLVFRPETKSRFVEMLGKLLNQKNQNVESVDRQYNQHTITAVNLKNANVTLFYVRLDDLLVMTIDERMLQRVVDTVKGQKDFLSEDKNFSALSARLYKSMTGEFSLNVPAIKNSLISYWRQAGLLLTQKNGLKTDEDIQQMFSMVDGVQYAGGSFLIGKPHRFKWVMLLDPVKNGVGFGRLANCTNVDRSAVNLIPKEMVILQWDNCLDFPALYKNILESVKRAQKTEIDNARSPINFLEKTLGISLERDILPNLGGEMGWFYQGFIIDRSLLVPKFGIVLKVNNQPAAEETLRKLTSTPLTILQKEEYRKYTVNFISLPFINTLKPSYMFVDGYLFISTLNDMNKKIIDVRYDPQLGLASQDVFQHGQQTGAQSYQMVSFFNIQEFSRQAMNFVEWEGKMFNQKFQQILDDETKTTQGLQNEEVALKTAVESLNKSQNRLKVVEGEVKSLEAQIQASAVVMESKNTLSQEGKLKSSTVPQELGPARSLELKKSLLSSVDLDIKGIQKDVQEIQVRKDELLQKQEKIQQLKLYAQKHRYYVDEVIIPFLRAMELVVAHKTTFSIKDAVGEAEMFMTVQ